MNEGRFTHIACRAHAVPLPCRAANGLERVLPIWFTQCGRVWFTLAMPCSVHAVLLKATAQHGHLSTAVLFCGLEKNGMVGAWQGHVMASVNQTRPHCVNQMGKTRSKPLGTRHGRGTAWARHDMCESALNWYHYKRVNTVFSLCLSVCLSSCVISKTSPNNFVVNFYSELLALLEFCNCFFGVRTHPRRHSSAEICCSGKEKVLLFMLHVYLVVL
jgi:hypothetical protein